MGKEGERDRDRESVIFVSPRAVYVLTCIVREVCKTVCTCMISRAFKVAGSDVDECV